MITNTSQYNQHKSLLKQLKRRVLIVVGLFVFVLIFYFPVGIFNASVQHKEDKQQIALQENESNLLLSMVNQSNNLRRYIATNDTAYLESITSGRQHFLLTVRQLKDQTQGSDFSETTIALAQVEERANAWYRTYAQTQLNRMQSDKLVEARTASASLIGIALFDQFRASIAHFQVAINHDFSTVQFRLDLNSKLALIISLCLSMIVLIILYYNVTRFFHTLTEQLNILEATTNQLASGDLLARVQELTYDEFNRLGQSFNSMANDLTLRTRELEEQYRSLQEVSRLKSEFLANMSHELRTPLNAIIGFTEMMYDGIAGRTSDEQHEYLGDVLTSSRHLLQLINDVLDLAKVEAGKMSFSPEEVDLERLVAEVRDILRLLIASKRIRFETEIDPALHRVVIDPDKLKQVLYNYLSNALKFTPDEGQVTIRIRPEGNGTFLLEVEDTGKGIPLEDIGRLFVEFQQLDPGVTKKYQGTGLGLALTKRIVEAQGGKVGVRSIPGQGSTFFVLLPRLNQIIEELYEQEGKAIWARP